MKIIFLDIDGVLNTKKFRDTEGENYYNNPFCPHNMKVLQHLVNTTSAKIVLTSTWRHYWCEGGIQLDEMGQTIKNEFKKYNLEIFAKTSDFNENRNAEIDAFLETYKDQREIEEYVIIDDIDFHFDTKHFVKTEDETGLDYTACEKAINILRGYEIKNIDSEWAKVLELIKASMCEKEYSLWFKDLICVGLFIKSNTVIIECKNSTKRNIIEETPFLYDILYNSIKEVFGEVSFSLKDAVNAEEDKDYNASASDYYIYNGIHFTRRNSFFCPSTMSSSSDVMEYEKQKCIKEMLHRNPSKHFFQNRNVNESMLYRLLAIFVNLSEFSNIAQEIRVTKFGKQIEIYSSSFGLMVNKLLDSNQLYRNSFTEKYLHSYVKEHKYLACPFHSCCTETESPFYMNTDAYFTIYMLINLYNRAEVEIIENGHSTKILYEDGVCNTSVLYIEPSEKNATYIRYETPCDFSVESICNIVEKAALFAKGSKITFIDSEKGIHTSHCYKNVKEYLDGNHTGKDSYISKIKATGKDRYTDDSCYTVMAELAVSLERERGTAEGETYFNYALLPSSNVFAEALTSSMMTRLNMWLSSKTNRQITYSDIKGFMIFVLTIKTDDDFTEWSVKRKSPTSRKMIDDIIEDLVSDIFSKLENEGEIIKLIFDVFGKKDEAIKENIFPDGMK